MKVFSASTKVLLVGIVIGYAAGATYGWALSNSKSS